jgi:hypothetical protein
MNVHGDYFKDRNECGLETRPLLMTTAHQHEEAYIQLKTMNRIKLTYSNLGAKIFIIECETSGFCVDDTGLRNRHQKLFKNDTFTFMVSNDLVRSMPYRFVGQLTKNVFTKLDKGWMRKLKITLQQAEKKTIKKISLYRIIHPWDYYQDINDTKKKQEYLFIMLQLKMVSKVMQLVMNFRKRWGVKSGSLAT